MSAQKVITLDERRRCSFGRIGRKEDTIYLVTEYPDGKIVLTPARLVPLELGDRERVAS
jgi:hypothetical protein